MMMRSLTWKLLLAFVSVSITGALVAAIFVQSATQQGFQNVAHAHQQADFVTQMASYYQVHGSWDGVATAFFQPSSGPSQGINQFPPPPFILVDQQRVVRIAGHMYQMGQVVSTSVVTQGIAIVVDGQKVGTALDDGEPALNPDDAQFFVATQHALIFGSLVAFLIALGLGIVLARSLTKPVRELTTALHAMSGGELQQVVPVRSQDELGQLSLAFNRMNADVSAANQQRRQMTADIAHDLRTPVTVIAGYLEALRDGVLPPTPERFAILYEESQHLQRLIEDLRTLSLADAGELVLHRQAITPAALLQRSAAVFQHQAEQQEITLEVSATDDLPDLLIDVERMMQVLRNLISNALRYTPDGGTIVLSARHAAATFHLAVSDTGKGIMPDALPHIFDRFYRADTSRSQAQGESGLGLAIAKALVEAHGGTIRVVSQPDHGATFHITLPDERSHTET